MARTVLSGCCRVRTGCIRTPDLPPLEITQSRLDGIEAELPELVWGRMQRYRESGLPEEAVWALCVSRRQAELFDRIMAESPLSPRFVAIMSWCSG